MSAPRPLVVASAMAAWAAFTGPQATAATAASCMPAGTSASPKLVVELYTSEGCNSCPPADQWLSTLPRDGSVLALAFHVDYWNNLGWNDRFSDPAYTDRQRHLQSSSGARYIYTPQLIVSGRDFPGWRNLPAEALAGAAPSLPVQAPPLQLRREGSQLVAEIGPGSSGMVAGYWALLEDGHQSQVAQGENAGRALRHDHLVRRYQALAAWPAAEARQWRWPVPPIDAGHAARAVFVLTDGSGAKPLRAMQFALQGGC